MSWLNGLATDEHRVLRLSGVALALFGIFALVFATVDGIFSKDSVTGWQVMLLILVGMSVIMLPELTTLLFKNRKVTVRYKGATITVQELTEKIEHEEKTSSETVLDIIALQSLVFNIADIMLGEMNPAFAHPLEPRREELFKKFHRFTEAMPDKEAALEIRVRLTKTFLSTLDANVPGVKQALREVNCYVGEIDSVIDASFVKSVSRFQRNNGINPPDGIFGPSTFDVLTQKVGRDELRAVVA